MPRPQRAHGRPGTAVLPPGWSADHAATVAATLPHTCAIAHPGRPKAAAFDTTTGKYNNAAPTPHYVGACRVDALASTSTPVAGDEAVPTATYELSLALDAAPDTEVDDIVATSLGIELRVRDVRTSSEAFSRVFGCTENQS